MEQAHRITEDCGTDANQLLVQVADGDREAFDALYRDTAPTLMGVCLRVLRNQTEAEEALQEAFTSVWGKASQFDPGRSHAIGWLCTIARNRATDRLRGLPAHALLGPVEWAETTADSGPCPLTTAATTADRERLERCIEQLDARSQMLIRMAFFEGATYHEVAQRTGLPEGSVKCWIRRGLKKLRVDVGG